MADVHAFSGKVIDYATRLSMSPTRLRESGDQNEML